jgi:uncharacterized protein (TIGR02246 family)
VNIRKLIWASFALAMMVSAAVAQAAGAAAEEQAVAAAEHQWLTSQQTNNVELLAPLLDDKVVETLSEGKVLVGKDAVLADAKSTRFSSAEYTDLKVMVFGGHTAIATGTFIGKGTDSAGKPIAQRTRFTDTWVKITDDKWLCVATQNTASKM